MYLFTAAYSIRAVNEEIVGNTWNKCEERKLRSEPFILTFY